MSRQIKFRFWDIDKKQMYGKGFDGITQNSLGESLSDNLRPIISISGNLCKPSYAYNCITMQYTGLNDSNGIDIYESDILEYHNLKFIVIFSKGCFEVKEINSFNPIITLIELISKGEKAKIPIKIISNFHQSPELL